MTGKGRPLSSIVFGALDILAALFYIVLFTWIVPSRSSAFTVLVWAVSLLLAAGGVGLILGSGWGRRLAFIASVTFVVICVLLLLLLLSSVAYLHGIYDGVGQAGAAIGLLAAALTIELVGLLPLLQLGHLRRLKREGL
jgi:membrane-associated HD superfamily phosphohydrolase